MKLNNGSVLPQEILIDILSHLPAKSIGRCRCVSKSWESWLSQPEFIKKHKDWVRKFQGDSLLLVSDSHCLYSFSFSDAHHLFDEMTERANIVNFANHLDNRTDLVFASCDGLALVAEYGYKTLIKNPVTQQIRELPPSQFALDPYGSYTMHGFGYDSVSDDYKVVSLSYHLSDCPEIVVHVYSLKNDTWKKVKNSPYNHAVGHLDRGGAFVNGHIHWLACRTTDYSPVLVRFDFVDEEFYEVPLPPSLINNKRLVHNHLVVLGGYLCLFDSRYDANPDIWVMKEYGVGASWTKLIINVNGKIRPVCLIGQEQVVLAVKDKETVAEKLVLYDMEKEISNDIVINGIPDDFRAGVSFIESLVSPHLVMKPGGNDENISNSRT